MAWATPVAQVRSLTRELANATVLPNTDEAETPGGEAQQEILTYAQARELLIQRVTAIPIKNDTEFSKNLMRLSQNAE